MSEAGPRARVSPPPRLEPGIDPGRFLRNLSAAIGMRTVTNEGPDGSDPEELLRLHEHLSSAYPLVAEHLDRETVEGFTLLSTWAGSDPSLPPIVLMAHLDVVPVDPVSIHEWTTDPFGGTVADGYVWGRGALDDKGALIAIFEAIEHLLGTGFKPRRTVLVVTGHDEEVGGVGAAHAAAICEERGVRPWFVVDEGGVLVEGMLAPLTERPVALVGTAEKGYLNLRLTARAGGGHSSLPPRSTAIGVLSAAIAALEEHPVPPRMENVRPLVEFLARSIDRRAGAAASRLGLAAPAVGKMLAGNPRTDALIRTTTAATMVDGGIKPNALPREASATVNFRIVPGDSIASVVGHVRSIVGRDVEVEILGPVKSEASKVSSTKSEGWLLLERTIRETFPDAAVAPWVFSGATDSRFFVDLADDVYRFAPFRLSRDMLDGIHGTNERIRSDDAEQAVSFFATLIRNATG